MADPSSRAETLTGHGSEDLWARWTAAECRAKHADVPVVLWLRAHGLDGDPDGAEVVTVRDHVPGATASVARARPRTAAEPTRRT